MSAPAAPSTITVFGILGTLELPGREPSSLEERTRFVDVDVLDEPTLERGADRAEGGAVTARRERPRVAVGERPGLRTEQLEGAFAHLDTPRHFPAMERTRPLGEIVRIGSGGPHLGDRPGAD